MIDLNSGFIVDRCEKSDLVIYYHQVTFTLFQVKHPEKYEIKKKDDKERLRLCRQRKKLGLVKSMNVGDEQCQENQQQPVESTPNSFSTKQALSRSIKRAKKALPVSPCKKTEVISGLVKRYQIRVNLPETQGRKQMVLSEEEKEWLLTFFGRPDITYINPGRKDNVYIGKENSIRRYVQKRYLLWKLRDLLSIISGVDIEGMVVAETYRDSFGYELSSTSLYGFIKAHKQFVFNRDIPQGSCLREVCENACLFAKGLNKRFRLSLPTDPHNLVEENECDSSSASCMTGECSECAPKSFLASKLAENETLDSSESKDIEGDSQDVEYYKWCLVDGKVQKVLINVNENDAVTDWVLSIENLKLHIWRKHTQVAAFNALKKNLEENEILVQCDYSENDKNLAQDEIQSAYFGLSCFSIFSACGYHRSEGVLDKYPITIVSEASDHSRIPAFTCFNKVVEHMLEKINVPVDKVYPWSNGMTAQFRSRFIFMLLSQFDETKNLNDII